MRGLFAKAGVAPCREVREIRLAEPAAVEVGQVLFSVLLVAGYTVKVTGTSIGKGYQGVLRRWNFHVLDEGHGDE